MDVCPMNKAQTLLYALGQCGLSDVQISDEEGMTVENLSRIRHGTKSGERSIPKLQALLTRTLAQKTRQIEQRREQQSRAVAVMQRPPAPVRQVVEPQPFPSVRIQQVQAAPPPVKRPALLPQYAASMYPVQAPPDVIQGPAITYHAHYRVEPWPIGVPVHPPPELKVRLAWPRTPERWTQ